MNNLKVIVSSSNSKIGPVGATYRPVGPTCPKSCPMLGAGCYAQRGHIALHQRTATEKESLDLLLGFNNHVRHEVSGDSFRSNGTLDRDYVRMKLDWHKMHPGVTGWGYTHGWRHWTRAKLGPTAWPANFSALASVHSIEEAKAAHVAGWRTARIVDTPGGPRLKGETYCPIDLDKWAGREQRINCLTCRMCFPGKAKSIIFVKF